MRVKIIILIGLGYLFLLLGAVGLLLPVLPTTPFVLISAACFSYTPALKARIMRISFFKEYIENYERGCGLSPKTVKFSLGYLWTTLVISMLLSKKIWLTLLLLAIGIAVTTHILYVAKAKHADKQQVK